MSTPRFLFSALLILALAACGGGHDELNAEDAALLEKEAVPAQGSAGKSTDVAASAPVQQAAEQVTLSSNAVALGSALSADGAVSQVKQAYASGDTVYASVPVGGYGTGKEVTIYWFSAKGGSVKSEHKPIPAGAKFVSFSLSKADGMEAGGYTAQVDIGDAPVGMADFTVK